MFLQCLWLTNFRCFGPVEQRIDMSKGVTAFIGANGSGKTAVMHALLRLFGMTAEQRRVRRQDFHVSATESVAPIQRELVIEAILAFRNSMTTTAITQQCLSSSTKWLQMTAVV